MPIHGHLQVLRDVGCNCIKISESYLTSHIPILKFRSQISHVITSTSQSHMTRSQIPDTDLRSPNKCSDLIGHISELIVRFQIQISESDLRNRSQILDLRSVYRPTLSILIGSYFSELRFQISDFISLAETWNHLIPESDFKSRVRSQSSRSHLAVTVT